MKIVEKYKFYYLLLFFLTVFVVFSISKSSYSTQTLDDEEAKMQIFAPIISELIEKGVDSTFIIDLIKNPATKFDEKYAQVDVSMRPRPIQVDSVPKPITSIYRKIVTQESVDKINLFIQNNQEALKNIEEKYNVDKEVLSSLLWVETRHGDYLGYHHVPSVYLCLALADQPEFIEYNLQRMRNKFHPSKKDYTYIKVKLVERSKAKAKWALQELVALYKMSNHNLSNVIDLYGSYAGAFGIPQFLPSSYSKFAVDGNGDGQINLFQYTDALFSAANYLKINGFGQTDDSKRKAIFAYNHSSKYVNTIMTLSKLVKKSQNPTADLPNVLEDTTAEIEQ